MNAKVIEPLVDGRAGRGSRQREWIVIACLLLLTVMAIVIVTGLYYYNQHPSKNYRDRPEEWKPFIWDALDPPPRQP